MADVSAQSLAALAEANRIRLRHAAVIRSIASPADAADVLRTPPADTDRLRLARVLKAVPRYGPVRTTRLLNRAAIPQARLQRGLGELTERERNRIADELVRGQAPPTTVLQRQILAHLNGSALSHQTLTAWTNAHPSGTASALRGLAERGLVVRDGEGWRKVSP